MALRSLALLLNESISRARDALKLCAQLPPTHGHIGHGRPWALIDWLGAGGGREQPTLDQVRKDPGGRFEQGR